MSYRRNNLQLIKNSIGKLNPKQMEYVTQAFFDMVNDAKDFYLDIDESMPGKITDLEELNPCMTKQKEFKLPYNSNLFAFTKEYSIVVSGNTPVKWIGFYIRHYPENVLGDMELFNFNPIYLNYENTKKVTMSMSEHLIGVGRMGDTGLGITYAKHICSDKDICMINETGTLKEEYRNKDIDNLVICKALFSVDLMFKTAMRINHKIIETERIQKEKTFIRTSENTGEKKEVIEIPYTQTLSGKSYTYDPESPKGIGTKHGHRYDVRRHPRIQNGRLIWVEPYIRGSGEYIAKIYINKGIIKQEHIVNEKIGLLETLTKKYRLIEWLVIKFITIWRKIK